MTEPAAASPPASRSWWRRLLPELSIHDWPVAIVPVMCAIVFAWQLTQADEGVALAMVPAAMDGRWWTLITAIFAHGGWLHIASNLYSCVMIAPWVITRFGGGLRSVVPFHIFFLLCGIAGNLMFLAIHPHGEVPTLGASGAIYGLAAAVMRLDPRRHALTPILSRQTLNMIWFFIWTNALVIVLYGGPVMLLQLFHGQALQIPIAWEAHLGGFIAGFVLIQLMAGKGWPRAMEPRG